MLGWNPSTEKALGVIFFVISFTFVMFEVCEFKSIRHSTAFEYSQSMHTATVRDEFSLAVVALVVGLFYLYYIAVLCYNIP